METFARFPAFFAYAVSSLVLSGNLMILWAYSGFTRAKSKTAVNEEDAKLRHVELVTQNPPSVARVLRAFDNAQASIFPFLLLGIVFVLAGGSAGFAKIDFTIFVVARLLHSVVYIAAKQPWRTLAFLVGVLALVALMADIAWLLLL